MPFSDLWNLPASSQPPSAAQTGYSAAEAVKGLNPLQKLNWTMQNRGPALGAIGAGVARGDVAGGFAEAAKLNAAQDLQNQEVAEKEKARLALKQYLMSQGMSEPEAEQASQNEAVTKHIWSLQEIEAKKKADAEAASADLGLNLTYSMDKDGKWHAWQLAKNGRQVEFKPQDGSEIVPPGDIALAKAAGTARGKLGGESAIALPQIEADIQQADAALADIMNDPELNNMVGNVQLPVIGDSGIPRKMKPNLSEASRDWQKRFDNLKSQAWNQARQSLKGAGPITDYEGQMATKAVEAMDAATSIKQFKQAADDFRWHMATGLWIAKKKAFDTGNGADPGERPKRQDYFGSSATAAEPGPAVSTSPRAPQKNTTKSGVSWSTD